MRHPVYYAAVLVAAVLLGVTVEARAQTAVAQNNATVQAMGPRPGTNGLAFFNVEGRPGGANASYGVLEFNSTDLGYGQVSEVDTLSLTLFQDLASFTSRGSLNFYVTDDTSDSIANDGSSSLVFDAGDVEGLNGQLANLYELGRADFFPIRSGWLDTYTFAIDLNSDLESYLIGQINSGGVIRIVITPEANPVDGEQVGATWAGFMNTLDNSAPTLTVNAQ